MPVRRRGDNKTKRKRQVLRPTNRGVLNWEACLEKERRRAYLGSARVDLNALRFDDAPQHQANLANIQRLLITFGNAGCLRLPSQHHVPAVISVSALEEAMRSSALTKDHLFQPDVSRCSLLQFPDTYSVQCLHGRHRIAAAKQHLSIHEQWWVVDFYSADLSPQLRASLVRQNVNEQAPNVGEVFFQILHCNATDAKSMGFWWSQIHSRNEITELRRLLRRPALADAFRTVARFPAFGRQLLPGNTRDVLGLKCDEEVIHGLHHIVSSWNTILEGVPDSEHRLDPQTVEAVQLRCVKHCQADHDLLSPLVRRGTIFGNFHAHERTRIWHNLLTLPGRIPSLSVFFEDFKHLEDVGKCVRKLLEMQRGQTVSQTLDLSFVSRPQLEIPRDVQYDLARRRLFLFAMQHLHDLRPESILTGGTSPRQVEEPRARAWHALAKEAQHLGFHSSPITRLLTEDPDRVEARRSLDRARNADHFEYDAAHLESLIDEMVVIYAKARHRPVVVSPAVYVTDGRNDIDDSVGDEDDEGGEEEGQGDGEEENIQLRNGRPCQQAFVASKAFLSLENMHPTQTLGTGVLTSLFIRRDVYLSFFGDLDTQTRTGEDVGVGAADDPDVQHERPGGEPIDSDWEMLDLDDDPEPLQATPVPVQPRFNTNSPSMYSQSLDEDFTMNAANRLVGAEALAETTRSSPVSVPTQESSSPVRDVTRLTYGPGSAPASTGITLVIYEGDDIRSSESIQVDDRSPEPVETAIAHYIDQKIYPFDTSFRALALEQCFEAALLDPERTLFLMRRRHVTLSTAQLLSSGSRKRVASEEIHARPHKRAIISP